MSISIHYRKLVWGAAIALLLAACTTPPPPPPPPPPPVKLPWKNMAPDAAIIFGSIRVAGAGDAASGDATLGQVAFQYWGRAYACMGRIACGERSYVLGNRYFFVPNIEPGKYFFSGFDVGRRFNGLVYGGQTSLIEVKPGQLVFSGSFDYSRNVAGTGDGFNLTPLPRPDELEVLEALKQHAKGSVWESAFDRRILELQMHRAGGAATPLR